MGLLMKKFYEILYLLDRLINYWSIVRRQQKKEDDFIQAAIEAGEITKGRSVVRYNPWTGDLTVIRTILPVRAINVVSITMKIN